MLALINSHIHLKLNEKMLMPIRTFFNKNTFCMSMYRGYLFVVFFSYLTRNLFFEQFSIASQREKKTQNKSIILIKLLANKRV